MSNSSTLKIQISELRTKQEVADQLGLHRNTIAEMFRSIGITGKKRLSIAQLVRFYTEFGSPGEYDISLSI